MGNKSETSIGGKHSELNCSLGIAAGYTPTFRGFYRMMKALVSHLVILGRSLEKYALERWIIWRLWSWGEEPQSVRFCRGSRIEGRGARGRGSRVEGRGSRVKLKKVNIKNIGNIKYGGIWRNMEVWIWIWRWIGGGEYLPSCDVSWEPRIVFGTRGTSTNEGLNWNSFILSPIYELTNDQGDSR